MKLQSVLENLKITRLVVVMELLKYGGSGITPSRLANRPGIPRIVPEIVLLSRRPGNLPNVPGSLANWLRFQAPVSVYDIHTRNATALGERRQAVLRNLQNFQLT